MHPTISLVVLALDRTVLEALALLDNPTCFLNEYCIVSRQDVSASKAFLARLYHCYEIGILFELVRPCVGSRRLGLDFPSTVGVSILFWSHYSLDCFAWSVLLVSSMFRFDGHLVTDLWSLSTGVTGLIIDMTWQLASKFHRYPSLGCWSLLPLVEQWLRRCQPILDWLL